LNGGSIKDAAGNTASISVTPVLSDAFTVNRAGITSVAVTPKTYKLGEPVDFVVNFSSPVFVSGIPRIQFLLDASSVSKAATFISGNGSSALRFRYVVAASDFDVTGIDVANAFVDLNGGAIKDAFNSAAAVSFTQPTTAGVLIDGVAPTISGVTTPSASAYITGNKLTFAVTFSEVVNVAGAPKLLVTIGGATRQVDLASTSGTGTSTLNFEYPIVAGDSSITGVTVTGISLAGGTIKDAAGNDATLASGLIPAASAAFAVNRTTITSFAAPADKTYKAGDVLEFTATFSNVVTVTGVPRIQFLVDSSSAAKNATYVSGNGTTTLRFRYTVVAGDLDTSGIDLTSAQIDLNGGTITDSVSTPVLTFPVPNLTAVLVDGVAPRAFSTINGPIPGTYVKGIAGQDTLTFTVPFDDVVTVAGSGTPTLQFTLGANVRQATFVGAAGFTGNSLEFRYTVQTGDYATSASIAANPINLNGATIRDANGNDASLAILPQAYSGVIVNVTSVTQVAVASPANRYYRAGDTILLAATFDAPVTVTGTPTIALSFSGNAPAAKDSRYVSGSGTKTLTFAYTVVDGDLDLDGVQFGFPTITLPVGTAITNTGGNVLLAFVPPDISGIRVDAVVPTRVGVTVPPAGNYKAGDTLQLTVSFNESVQVMPEAGTGNVPRIALVVGSRTRYASYVAGTETPVLVFDYVVANDDVDTNGIVVGTAILLNGGFITDIAGNTGSLVINPGPTNAVLVDGVAPTISRFAVPLSTKNGSYRAGTSIPITATMSKPVVAGSTLDVVLDTSAVVTLTAATTGTTLSGTYVVEAGQNSPDLDVVGIFNANVADAFGNLLASTALPIAGNSIAGSRAIVVDTITPAPVGISLGTGVGDGATAAEATQAAGVVTVTGESGATINVTFTRGANTVTKTLTGTGGAQAVVLVAGDVTTLGNGLVNVSATQADAAGNTSTAATSSFTIDTVAPNAPTLALGTGVSNGATLAEATQASGVVTVTGESGAAIVVTFTGALGTVTRNVTGTGSSQAVSLTAGDVATLGNGTVSVAASQTDAAGNPQTAAPATASFAIDTAAPAAATLVLGPGVTAPVSRAEALQAAGVVVVTGELGATVTVTFTQGANTVTKTLTGTGGAQAVVLTAGDLSSLGDGAVTVAASQTDAAGNLQTAAVNTLSFTLDTAVPNAVTVALGSGVSGGVTSAEALQASGVVTVTGESGAAITVVFTRGVNTVTKTLTGSGAVQAVVLQAGDLTALGDGVVNVSVTQADAAGNVSTAATTSFTLDTAAPSAAVLALGPGVTAPVSRSEALQAAGVVTVSGEVGAAITVTFTQGVNTVTKTFTGTGSAQPVVLTTSDLITLGDGAVTVSASQTDVAGNVQSGAANTLSFNLDTAVPNPVAITLGTGVGDGATAAEATQAAGVVTVTGESGATINVTFTRGANTVTKTLTGTGGVQAVVLLAGDVTTLGNGLVNVSATQADATGNTSTAATGSFTIDTVAPNAPTLALGTGVSNGATLAEATQASGVVTVTGESGAAIAVTFTGALGTVTRNVTGTGSSQAVALTAGDVATLGNGTVSVAASQTDAAGNPQTAAPATASFTLDTAAPAAATLVLGPGITDPVSRSEALQAAGIVTVTGEAGAAITVTFTRAGNTITKNLTGTGSAQAVTLTASDLTTLGDGVVVISAVQSDAAGNQQTAVAASVSFSLDTAAPAAATLVLGPGVSSPVSRSEATQAAGVVTATGENGASLVVTFARGAATVTKTLTGMGLAQAVVLTTADLTTLGDGLVSVSASQTDAAGNVQAAAASSLSFVLDAAAPNAVAIVLGNGVSNGATAAEATQASGAVVVTGESGAEITVAFTRGANTVTKTLVGTGSAQPVVLTTSDLTALGDGAVTVSASQTDAAGNQQTAVPATVSFTLDRAAPNTPVLVLGPGVTNPVSMGEATQASGVVTVTGENGAAITVTFTRGASTVSKSLTGTGGVQPIVLTAAEVTSLGSGSVAVSVAQADAAGNQSATASLSFSLDPVAPNAAIIALGAGVADGATAAEATQASGVVTVTGEIGAAITVVFTRGVTTVTKTLTGTGSGQPVILTTADLTALGDGAVTVSVSQADAAGNPQTGLASTVSFTLDTVTPTVSALTSAVPNGTYRVGNTVQIALNYSEPVFVTGVPTIPLNISPTRSASYVSGSGTNQLLFTYTVGTGDTASRLNNASSSLDGTGIQLRDAAGNGVSLALPGPTAGGALASSSDIVIDGAIRITATGFGTTAATATVFNRSVTSIPIRFNVPVTGVSLQSFRLFYENRSVSLAGAVIRGSGTNWTLTLPAKATSLRGNYRLAVGGAGSGIQSNGVAMNAASRLHWRRV
jgi:hypothetical protein